MSTVGYKVMSARRGTLPNLRSQIGRDKIKKLGTGLTFRKKGDHLKLVCRRIKITGSVSTGDQKAELLYVTRQRSSSDHQHNVTRHLT